VKEIVAWALPGDADTDCGGVGAVGAAVTVTVVDAVVVPWLFVAVRV
jgi:hypothetical protein